MTGARRRNIPRLLFGPFSRDFPGYSAERLVEFWKSLTPEKVMRFGAEEQYALARPAFGGRVDAPAPPAVPFRLPAARHRPSELFAIMLFTPAFIHRLVELGYADAKSSDVFDPAPGEDRLASVWQT